MTRRAHSPLVPAPGWIGCALASSGDACAAALRALPAKRAALPTTHAGAALAAEGGVSAHA